MLRECTSDGGRESHSNGSAARDRDSVFSSNHSAESGGNTPAGAESAPMHSGTEESVSNSSTAESVVSAPEAGPSGRAAHELLTFLLVRKYSRLREGRTRGETQRLQEMAMTTIDETVCALGQQARDVQGGVWALLAEAPQDSGKCGVSTPLGTAIREVEKATESNAAIDKSEYRELWLKSDRTELHKLWDPGTFTPVDEVPAGCKVIGCKFVRTWKGNERGEVVKPKSRLVALGYSQTEASTTLKHFHPLPPPRLLNY